MEFQLIKEKGNCVYFEGYYNGKKYEVILKKGKVGEGKYYIFDALGHPLDEESDLYREVDSNFRYDCFEWYMLTENLMK